MHTINVHLNINELSVMKRQYDICYSNKCQICLSQNYQARKLFKDILYIPGCWDRERIALTDDLQLHSNHNGSFTREILWGQNIDDI